MNKKRQILDVFYRKSEEFEDAGDLDKAIAWIDKAIAIYPNDAEIWAVKGQYLIRDQKFEEAIICFDRAIELSPQFATDYMKCCNRAFCFQELGKFEEAIEALNKAIEIDPNHSEDWYNKGHCLRKIGKFEDAIVCFDKAIEMDPNDIGSWTWLKDD